MNRIHRKSSIPQTAEIITAAHDRGESLLWERYEKQIPLCAFTDNGLSCRSCFHGPCRINPFGDEPRQGVCGADRNQIIMENLFQTTLAGVLETARDVTTLDPSSPELPDITPDLPRETEEKLRSGGLLPVRQGQLLEVQNSYFSHKGYLPRTLRDLTRLGLIHYGFLKRADASSEKLGRSGHSFDPEGANILLLGQPPAALLQALQNEAGKQTPVKGINLLGQGSKAISSLLPIADHGSPELALAMNLDALIIAPNAHFPALEDLAEKLGLPVVWVDDQKPLEEICSQAIELALHHRQNASYLSPSRIHSHSRDSKGVSGFFSRAEEIRSALKAGRLRGIVALYGETNVKQTFFERTLTLMENSIRQNCLVLLGGELAAQADLLNGMLAQRMAGQWSVRSAELARQGLAPVMNWGSFAEVPKFVHFAKELSQGKGFSTLPLLITFPEFSRASTWATAVSFLALGFAVQVGIRLPFWGSPTLAEVLLKDWPQISGGQFLASPSLPSSQTQAEEIIAYLDAARS